MTDAKTNLTATVENQRALASATLWEKAATTRWGGYVTEVEKRAILGGQSLAEKPAQALEMGCEGGRWSKLLSDLGWEMTCVDVDRQMLDICQQKVPGAKCILASPHDKIIPCDSKSMSLLLCIEVAPVMDSEWFLPEAARVLSDDGILIGILLNKASWRGKMNRMKRSFFGCKGDEFYKSNYRNWKSSLYQAGFNLVQEEGFCWGPFGRTSNSPLIPLFTRSERLLGLHRLITFSPWVAFIARKGAHMGLVQNVTVKQRL
jgi:SAM-dependent methyltransferase